MTNISDLASYQNTQYFLKLLGTKLNDTQRQATTGFKSDTLAGLGAQGASQAISLRNTVDTLDAYTNNLNAAKGKISVVDAAMGTITSDANDVLTTLREQLQGTSPQAAIISNQAQIALKGIMDKMNVQFEGRYVFSGDDVTNPPLANQSTINSQMSSLVSGWLSGTPTVASIVSNAQGVTNANLGYSATSLVAGQTSTRVDQTTDITTSVSLNQPGFNDVLRGIAIIANLPQPSGSAQTANYWTAVNAAMQLIDQGSKTVSGYQGVLGNTANQVDNLISQHADMQTALTTSLSDVEDVDMADVSTRLQSLTTQMQASYSVIAQMKNISLINYIN